MEIRFATAADTIHVMRSLQNKHIDYNTPAQAKNDIALGRLIVAVDGNKIVGSIAIVPEEEYQYTAIKRMCVYNKKYRGRGIAKALMEYVCALDLGTIGATPWDNPATIHLLEKFGFKYQYTFMEHYNFYKKI